MQYGVPWQILAAINEIETNYGTDQSVSSAGAVGWMQFMPATWLQYGVDALDAGYADPYNPVDAIFAAARYLRAAGAATDLHGAILAYNHSEEYADSVMLRAKLISTYPRAVIATLTGLVDGRPPVTGQHLAWGPPVTINPPASSATAGAAQSASPAGSAPAPSSVGAAIGSKHGSSPSTPGSSAAPTPAAAARAAAPARSPMQLVELTSGADARVVAVQDGRVVQIGTSAALGRFLVLRDVYGDVFTYAGLGSVAPTYTLPRSPASRITSPLVEVASRKDPTPKQAASAGNQSPVTLQRAQQAARAAGGRGSGFARRRRRRRALRPRQGPPVRAPREPGRARGCRRQRRRQGASRARIEATAAATRLGRLERNGARIGIGHPRRSRRAHALRRPPRRRPDHDRPGAGARQLGPAAGGAAPPGREVAGRAARRDRDGRVPALEVRAPAHGALRPRDHDHAAPATTSPPASSTTACSRCSRSSRAAG